MFSCVFCDFGDEFEVVDPNGEEPIESYVGKITKVSTRDWNAVLYSHCK